MELRKFSTGIEGGKNKKSPSCGLLLLGQRWSRCRSTWRHRRRIIGPHGVPLPRPVLPCQIHDIRWLPPLPSPLARIRTRSKDGERGSDKLKEGSLEVGVIDMARDLQRHRREGVPGWRKRRRQRRRRGMESGCERDCAAAASTSRPHPHKM